jgi:DNA-binding transcriptional LysR family regulator
VTLISAVPRLHALAALEAAGSFSGAAADLGISQSAVSQHVAALERQVATVLVDRGSRPVQLTAAGHVLAEHARAVAVRLESAERDLDDVLGRQERRLRLGSVPTALASFVPGAIARMRAEHPDVTLTVVDDHVQGLLPRLRERELDLAVVFTTPGTEHLGADLVTVPLFDDAYRVLVPIHHRLAKADKDPTLRDLRDEDWVGGAGGSTWFRVVRDACRAQGFEPHVGVVSDDHLAVQAFVAAGLGVAVVPGLAAALRVRGVTARDVLGAGPVRQLAVALPAGDYRPRAAMRMTELLQRATRSRR